MSWLTPERMAEREAQITEAMAETGESYEIVAEMWDAMECCRIEAETEDDD